MTDVFLQRRARMSQKYQCRQRVRKGMAYLSRSQRPSAYGPIPSAADGAFRPRQVEGLGRFARIAGLAGGKSRQLQGRGDAPPIGGHGASGRLHPPRKLFLTSESASSSLPVPVQAFFPWTST